MSGGFFRGTSADQDTRFSNKQAKLLKSQKFAPELEHLVDMSKVKMDVMRPWIAHKVTELLGFDDEVVINFVYGLLEEKVVNGKEIQISLTGFMEKNTGKFMKELWTLLLSAQKNASGVPQQFLDAKEEETRRKKAETDRIMSEIQRKKEKERRDIEQDKGKMDGKTDAVRDSYAAVEPSSRHETRASSRRLPDERELNGRSRSRGRDRVSKSPKSADRSPSLSSGTPSRSISRSISGSKSHSNGQPRSRSISGSPRPGRRSVSSQRLHRSPSRRSVSPPRRDSPLQSLSPPRRESSPFKRSRRRSPSPVRRRLHSPTRRKSRSPTRRKSRSPTRRRSRSPPRRRSRSPPQRRSRSPLRRRSPSPLRRSSPSPVRRRSPSPNRRRSPSPQGRSRSPVRRRSRTPIRLRSRTPSRYRQRSPMRYRPRSPVTRRSRSPWRRSESPRHISPSAGRRRSPSPVRRQYRRASPRHRSPSRVQHRNAVSRPRRSPSRDSLSLSPQGRSSHSPISLTPPSPVGRGSPKRQRRSPLQSSRDGSRSADKHSPAHRAPKKESAQSDKGYRPNVSLMSPQRNPKVQKDSGDKAPVPSSSLYTSSSDSQSPAAAIKRRPSSMIKPKELKSVCDSPKDVEAEDVDGDRDKESIKSKSPEKKFVYLSSGIDQKDPVGKARNQSEYVSERKAGSLSEKNQMHAPNTDLRTDQKAKSKSDAGCGPYAEFVEQDLLPTHGDVRPTENSQRLNSREGYIDHRGHSLVSDTKGSSQGHESEKVNKMSRKDDGNDQSGSLDSVSEESDYNKADVHEKRKHKRSKRKDVGSEDDHSYGSPVEGRKEAKRRRREEKRLRKEGRRRRREERRRKKEGRRAEKLKYKSVGDVSPLSDSEKSCDGFASDGEPVAKRGSSDYEETLSDPKKLEIELREKALESLRAKKGFGH